MGKYRNLVPLIAQIPALEQLVIQSCTLSPELEEEASEWDKKLSTRLEPFRPSEVEPTRNKRRPSKEYLVQNAQLDSEVSNHITAFYPTLASKTAHRNPPMPVEVVEFGLGNGAVLTHLVLAAQWKFHVRLVDFSWQACRHVSTLLQKRMAEHWLQYFHIQRDDILHFSKELMNTDVKLVVAVRTLQFLEEGKAGQVLEIWGEKLLARNDGLSAVVVVHPRPQDNANIHWGTTRPHPDELFEDCLSLGANRTIRSFRYLPIPYYRQRYTMTVWW